MDVCTEESYETFIDEEGREVIILPKIEIFDDEYLVGFIEIIYSFLKKQGIEPLKDRVYGHGGF